MGARYFGLGSALGFLRPSGSRCFHQLGSDDSRRSARASLSSSPALTCPKISVLKETRSGLKKKKAGRNGPPTGTG